MIHTNSLRSFAATALLTFIAAQAALAQSVCLPAPRLLTTFPMGGQIGKTIEVTVNGDNLDGATELHFSHPLISAKATTNAGRFVVTIGDQTPPGIHEARVMTSLGISTCRAFSVGTSPEANQTKPNQTAEQAMPLELNSVCNAVMTQRAVDHYSFTAKKGQRIIVECASAGIDSRMNAVLIIADPEGRDLVVDRLTGFLDFTIPADGNYLIKVHELTYKGGPHYFYRLALSEIGRDATAPRQPEVESVSSFSWRSEFAPTLAAKPEAEPNNLPTQAQPISLPAHIAGRFFPAADVDTFEFDAKKGDEWWVEVVSERLGLPTDPFVLVQQIDKDGSSTDLAELNDIAPPMKPSSNGYSYDGPPYNAGSADVLGKFIVKTDGRHRLQVRDLFGGTRSIPRHEYQLIIRKAQPDFTLAAWAFHMNLRNGDRNALSKPVALRNGRTMAFEVVTIRRDGFDGEIEIGMTGLPPGLSAQGFTIPKGKNHGILTITAADNAPRSLTVAQIFGTAKIGDKAVQRPCRLASMKWPVTNARDDIPAPRLLADVPVSVGGQEAAPITLRASEAKVWEVTAGEKLNLPLKIIRRGEFSGKTLSLQAFGPGFEKFKQDAKLQSDTDDIEIDTKALRLPVGEHVLAFYGSAVAKYALNDAALILAKAAEKDTEAKKTTKTAKPKDIVDIVVSDPIRIRVLAPEQK